MPVFTFEHLDEEREWLRKVFGKAFEPVLEAAEETRAELWEFVDKLAQLPEGTKEDFRRAFGNALVDVLRAFLNYLVAWAIYAVYEIAALLAHLDITRQQARFDVLRENPIMPLEPRDALEAWARGFINDKELENELLQQGISTERIEVLKQAARRYLTIDEAVRAYSLGLINRRELREKLKLQGVSDEDVDTLIEVQSRRLLDPSAILEAWRRQLITDDEAAEYFVKHGYDPTDIALLYVLSYSFPGISDLIRMMVRDAFNERVVRKYGYDEDYPPEIEYYVAAQGLDPVWAKYYWRAHWELPSPTMAIEMVRRGIIDEEDFDTLLRIADYPRYWREKMRELIYEVPTRVDVRRMYDLGVVDEKYVFETYKKLGYNDEDAFALTEFTVIDTISEERNKLRTQLLNAYEEGLITERELREGLRDLRYNDNAIEVIVAAKKTELEVEKLKAEKEIVHQRYLQGIIDENKAIAELAHLGVPAEAVTRVVTKWRAEKLQKHRRLTLTQLRELWRKRLVSEDRVLAELQEAGYTEDDARLLLALIKAGGSVE